MNNSQSRNSTGLGFDGALFILFLGLKLTHNISWSWIWVFAPIWAVLLLVVVLMMVALLLDRFAE